MKCPTCPDTPLVMAERQGVEIDYCPACRGIWLDRGELDKLLDRAASAVASQPAHAPQVQPPAAPPPHSPTHAPTYAPSYPPAYGDKRYGYGDRDHDRRKKSWLHDIFD